MAGKLDRLAGKLDRLTARGLVCFGERAFKAQNCPSKSALIDFNSHCKQPPSQPQCLG
jgi:hypothetical protein